MFWRVWAWVVEVCKSLLRWSTKQWYLVEIRREAAEAWDDRYPVHCTSLAEAKRYVVDTTDTLYWVRCRILAPDGTIVDEPPAKAFYAVPPDIAFMYIETTMSYEEVLAVWEEVLAVWRKQQMKTMDSRECSDVRQ